MYNVGVSVYIYIYIWNMTHDTYSTSSPTHPPKKKGKKTWDAQSFPSFQAAQQGLGSHYVVGKPSGVHQIETRIV